MSLKNQLSSAERSDCFRQRDKPNLVSRLSTVTDFCLLSAWCEIQQQGFEAPPVCPQQGHHRNRCVQLDAQKCQALSWGHKFVRAYDEAQVRKEFQEGAVSELTLFS